MGKFKDIWDSTKDGNNAVRRSFLRYAIIITAIFLIFVGFVTNNNLVRWFKAGVEIRKQEKQMRILQSEIEEMDRQIHTLSSSRDSLERFARERFYFAEPGDDVYVIEDKN